MMTMIIILVVSIAAAIAYVFLQQRPALSTTEERFASPSTPEERTIAPSHRQNAIHEYTYGMSPSSAIPNIVWSYWNSQALPEMVQMMLRISQLNNPHAAFVTLCDDMLPEYLPEWFGKDVPEKKRLIVDKFRDMPARFSDFVRIHLLKQYGGIWMDASSILSAPLDWLHAIQRATGAEYIGYYIAKPDGLPHVIENWFMSCVPGSRFIAAWCEEFEKFADFPSAVEYVADAEGRRGIRLDGIIPGLRTYLAQHVAAQCVLQQSQPSVKYKLHLFPAKEGPFKAHEDCGWDHNCVADSLLLGPAERYLHRYPLTKFIGPDRGGVREPHMRRLKALLRDHEDARRPARHIGCA